MNFIVSSLLTALLFILFSNRTVSSLSPSQPCEPCEIMMDCEMPPKQFCVWGETRDACNRRVCAQGPGNRCGGYLNILGVCGEGLMCKTDERCHGCSLLTMECFKD